jgi:serine-type D-Ala-D-Ala carboxypeptidase (penicillin-binding protein 5/6)
MKRYVIATILFILAIEIICAIPIMVFTPIGSKIIATLNPTPIPPTPTPLPVLNALGSTAPTLKSPVAYLLDADTNNTLLNVRGTEHLPMASTTKMMTALIALQIGNPSQIVTVKQDAVTEVIKNLGSNAGLKVGDKLPLIDMLYGLMLPSGDDAAIAIADTLSGSPTNFVKTMNQYAHKLHLNNTHYINPDGLTYYDGPNKKADPNEYTTAADLAQLARYALRNPMFAQIVQTQQFVIDANNDHGAYDWINTNEILDSYPGMLGVKTGYTVEAGYCLVFAARNGKHTLIGVVLQGKDKDDRFADAPTLLDWGLALPLAEPTPTPTPLSKQK